MLISSELRGSAAVGRIALLGLLGFAVVLQGCSSTPPLAESGAQAYKIAPPPGSNPNAHLDYVIGPLDILSITVFQERDLSLADVPVDASGNIIFPLIGQIQVAGLSSAAVSTLIARRLGERFLVNPQVSVLIKTSVSQKVTVDGEVKDPGVFALQGETTLIQAVAMAKGATNVANLDQVVIFRQVEGVRYAARFDLDAIRNGRAADPQIRGDDVVVVGLSRNKAVFRDVLAIAPTLTTAFVAISQIARN